MMYVNKWINNLYLELENTTMERFINKHLLFRLYLYITIDRIYLIVQYR